MIGSTLALLLASPLAPAITPAHSAQRDDEQARLSVELAALLNSEASTRVQIHKLGEETFPQQFANDPNFAVLEKDYPGITREAIAAIMPILTTMTIDALPAMQREIAGVYAKYFDAAELGELLAFYRSPTGTKVIESVSSGLDFSEMVGSAMRSQGEAEVTQQDFVAGTNAGIATMIRALSVEETAEVIRFGTSPLGRKLAVMNEEVQQLSIAIANRPQPEMEKQVEAAVTGVMERRIAQDVDE